MMPIINYNDVMTIILSLLLFVFVTVLGKETKKSIISGLLLGLFLVILIGHAIEFTMINTSNQYLVPIVARCLMMDFIFILLSFFAYLWVDDIETKTGKRKSINNSLDWFWSKI